MKLAIIPARGGSQRIPRKNVREFCGRPMIAWSIAAAQDSGCFDRIVVSTDDAEIAAVAREWGAEVPFVRPAELSDAHTATRPVINHAIGALALEGWKARQVCCIYATAPFLTGDLISAGWRDLEASGADFVFSAAAFSYPIQRAIRQCPGGGVAWVQPEHALARSQDLEPTYHDAAQFYWGRSEAFLANRKTVSDNSRFHVLPAHRVHDIDEPEDWVRAEFMFRAMEGSGGKTSS